MKHAYIIKINETEHIIRIPDSIAEQKLARIREDWEKVEIKKVENMTQEQRTEFCKDMMKLFTINEIYDFYKARIICDARKEKQVREICQKQGAFIKTIGYKNNAYKGEPEELLFEFEILNYGV